MEVGRVITTQKPPPQIIRWAGNSPEMEMAGPMQRRHLLLLCACFDCHIPQVLKSFIVNGQTMQPGSRNISL